AFVLSQDQTLRRDRSTDPKAGSAVYLESAVRRGTSGRPFLTRPASIAERFLLCTVVKPRARRTGLGVTRSLASHAVQFSRCERTRDSPRRCTSSRRGPAPKERLAAPPEASTGASRSNTRSRADQSVRPANR